MQIAVAQFRDVHHDQHIRAVECFIDARLAAKPRACFEIAFDQCGYRRIFRRRDAVPFERVEWFDAPLFRSEVFVFQA